MRTKSIIIMIMLTMWCSFVYSQDYINAPKKNEKVIAIITKDCTSHDNYICSDAPFNWYSALLKKATKMFPNRLIDIRQCEPSEIYDDDGHWLGPVVAKVVELYGNTETHSEDVLSKTMNKALQNIREGSRLALDQIKITNGDKEEFKDHIIEILLDNGYKIVAKDYLDKLYEEQQAQQSGIYNDRTTVQENNFSAVGYYINVKKSDTSIKVQIINVSTGEYESNVTVSID